MAALNDTMARIAILRSEVLSITHTLDARAAAATPGASEDELTNAATALMQAAISLQQAENCARRSGQAADRVSVPLQRSSLRV